MIGRTNAVASGSGGSGSGSLRVVGGTTRPSSASENTIWVNTSTTITSWVMCVDTPSSPEEGMIWFMLWKPTDKILTLDESFVVNLGGARQYISSTWVTVGGEVYINSSWVNLRTYMYKEGVFNSTWTWTKPTDSSMYTEESTYLDFDGKNSSRCYLYTNERVDLTNVNTINFDVQKVKGGNTAYSRFGISVCFMPTDYTTIYTEAEVTNTWQGTADSAARTVIPIDVSSVVGKYYIALMDYVGADTPGGGHMYVYGIELA